MSDSALPVVRQGFPSDPRLRLVLVLMLAFGFSSVTHLSTVPAMLAVMAVAVAVSGIGAAALVARMRAPGVLLVMLVLIVPLVAGQTPLLQLGPLTVWTEGVAAALLVGARFACIVAVAIAFLSTVPVFRLIAALRAIGVPAMLADIALLMLRYLDEVRGEFARMRAAMALRGQPLSIRHLRGIGWLLAALLLRAHARADRLWQAMRARGWGAAPPEAMAPPGRSDWTTLAVAGLALAGLLALDRLA